MTKPSEALRISNGKRQCATCGDPFREEEFGRNTDGTARLDCPSCRSGNRAASDGRRKDRGYKTAFAELARQIRGNKINVPHTSELAACIIAKFNSLEGFCDAWFTQIRLLQDTKPGSKVLMDQFGAINRLIVQSTEQRSSAPDLAGMSDEDLHDELLGIVLKAAETQPEIARGLLDALHLRVVSGDEEDAGVA